MRFITFVTKQNCSKSYTSTTWRQLPSHMYPHVSVSELFLLEQCPRCFWLQKHGLKRPVTFPTILSAMDRVAKEDTANISRGKGRPAWLRTGHVVSGVPKRLSMEHNGITLQGFLDDIVKKETGYVVIDYKSSAKPYDMAKARRFYGTQLSAYGLLLERNGFAPVLHGTLVFYCPDFASSQSVTFTLNTVDLTLDMPSVLRLLDTARMTMALPSPPHGSCEWCKNITAAAAYR